jgi:hypothetical protein
LFDPILEQGITEHSLANIVMSTDDTRVWRNGKHWLPHEVSEGFPGLAMWELKGQSSAGVGCGVGPNVPARLRSRERCRDRGGYVLE